MLKEDCLHQISWSLVTQGANFPRVELGEDVFMELRGPETAGMTGGLEANLLEQILSLACRDLPEQIDLDGEHFSAVEEAVRRHYAAMRENTLFPGVLPRIDAEERSVLRKLDELRRSETRDA